MEKVAIGFVLVFGLWSLAFYMFLRYIGVSEKAWRRSFLLTGAAILIQLFASVILNLFGAGILAPFITATIIAVALTRVLNVGALNAGVAALTIIVVAPLAASTIHSIFLQ